MNETPGAERLHIGIFGKTNSGKSTFLNALTMQQVSIVSDTAGTTTDPVYKPMEISPIGACVVMDTPGFDDTTKLGKLRVEKTLLAADKADLAILLLSATDGNGEGDFEKQYEKEWQWWERFVRDEKPVLFVISKVDLARETAERLHRFILEKTGEQAVEVEAGGEGVPLARVALARKVPEDFGQRRITGELVSKEDVVLLVMPQDIQAPKGRLILPQVQTIRELLDRECVVVSVTQKQLDLALESLKEPPKLIITDSQVFSYVYERKPKESMLTSFSVLFAAYKGDLPYYVQGAKAMEQLTESSRVLIAECCTHAPLAEDIGREKLPRMLRKRYGEGLTVEICSGNDFPEDLQGYDLMIQCGACMFNRSYVMARVKKARAQQIPMTNYGVAIAHLSGILDKIVFPHGEEGSE